MIRYLYIYNKKTKNLRVVDYHYQSPDGPSGRQGDARQA
jgi:hypothetical protein